MLNDARDEISGSHDARLPATFVDFLTSHWRSDAVDVPVAPHLALLAGRRERLSRHFRATCWSCRPATSDRAPFGATYLFRGGSDFLWLVGDDEPDSVLVMHPTKTGHESVLYARHGRTPRRARSSWTGWTARSGTAGGGPLRRSRACSASRPGRSKSCRRR